MLPQSVIGRALATALPCSVFFDELGRSGVDGVAVEASPRCPGPLGEVHARSLPVIGFAKAMDWLRASHSWSSTNLWSSLSVRNKAAPLENQARVSQRSR